MPRLTAQQIYSHPFVFKGEPDLLRSEAHPIKPFPTSAFGSFSGAVEALHRVIKAPLPVCGASVLASLSVAAQGAYDLMVDGRIEPLSLYLLTVAPSGARKTATDKAVFKEINERQKDEQQQYREAVEEYEVKAKAATKAKTSPPPVPTNPRFMVNDATTEALQQHMRRGKYGTTVLMTSEGGRFFSGYSLTGEAKNRGLSAFSALWDGEPTEVKRIAVDSSVSLYERRLCLHIQVQDKVVQSFLTDPVVAAQGLLARFLIAQVSDIDPREYEPMDVTLTPAMYKLYKAQLALLDKRSPKHTQHLSLIHI